MDNKNKVEVLINGKVYTLVGVESEEHIQRVARYIDRKMSEISQVESSKTLNTNMIATLTSLNVADDYFKQVDANNQLKTQLEQQAVSNGQNEELQQQFEAEKAALQQEYALISDKNKELQIELEYVKQAYDSLKQEFDEYIAEFDNNPTNISKIRSRNIKKINS